MLGTKIMWLVFIPR